MADNWGDAGNYMRESNCSVMGRERGESDKYQEREAVHVEKFFSLVTRYCVASRGPSGDVTAR